MILAATIFVWGGVCHAGECDWDIEILEMEARKHAEWFDVLVGQDDHHGEAYYQYQVEQLSSKSKLSMDESLELAIAYLEVGEYLLSKDILVGIISEDPEFAPAIFYRGIVAERSGDYELAEVYLLRDLDIDRDGYLGVGNWYLELMRRKLNPSASNFCRGVGVV